MGIGMMGLAALRWHKNLSALESPVNFTPCPAGAACETQHAAGSRGRGFFSVRGASARLRQRSIFEKHFAVKTRPVVVIHNVANGRIEVKSWKERRSGRPGQPDFPTRLALTWNKPGDRIDVTATILDRAAQPQELEASLPGSPCRKKRNCSSRRRRDLFTSSRSWAI